MYCPLSINYVRGHIDDLPTLNYTVSPLYPSLYPYVTHVINSSRPSPAFPVLEATESWAGPGNKARRHTFQLYNSPHNSGCIFGDLAVQFYMLVDL